MLKTNISLVYREKFFGRKTTVKIIPRTLFLPGVSDSLARPEESGPLGASFAFASISRSVLFLEG